MSLISFEWPRLCECPGVTRNESNDFDFWGILMTIRERSPEVMWISEKDLFDRIRWRWRYNPIYFYNTETNRIFTGKRPGKSKACDTLDEFTDYMK